jgi:hypothetical protein
MENKISKNDINEIFMQVDYGDQIALLIYLNQDGTINRKGSGNIPESKIVAMGISDTSIFKELLDKFDERAFDSAGSFNIKNKKGITKQYTLRFSGNNKSILFNFLLGSENNEGVNLVPYIDNYLIEAVKLTDKWYYETLKNQKKTKTKWWKFWE